MNTKGRPPHLFLTSLEVRFIGEFIASMATHRLLPTWRLTPNLPVLVLPGLAAGNGSTSFLRHYLARNGIDVSGWELGINNGKLENIVLIAEQVLRLNADHATPINLVGWSMGGIYAREVSRLIPDAVNMVITLGTPFTGSARANHAVKLVELLSDRPVQDDEGWRALSKPLPVPTTSIFSKSDGIVHWKTSLNAMSETSENIAVHASHLGIGHHPAVMALILERLSQPVDEWKKFEVRGLRRIFYCCHTV